MRSVDRSFYKSTAWKETSKLYLQSVSYWCERCKAKGIYQPARLVHHKVHLNKNNIKDPAIALGFDNLEALCQDCHNKEHFGDKTPSRWEIGTDGELKFF